MIKDKNDLYADMKALVKDGLIKIELYTQGGELVGVIEKPEDLTNELAMRFNIENLSVRTILTTPTLSLP